MSKSTKAATAARITTSALVVAGVALGVATMAPAFASNPPGALAVTLDAPAGAPMTPGGRPQVVTFHVQNSNDVAATLRTVTVSVANSDGSRWTATAGCSAADFTLGEPSFDAGDIAPGATKSGTFTITMNNLATDQAGCSNVTVPLYASIG